MTKVGDAIKQEQPLEERPGLVPHVETSRQTTRGAARWLAHLAVPTLDDGSGLNWPSEEGQTPTHVFWCHGAGGIGQFFLHAAELNTVPGALEIAARAARTVARGSRWANPSQCHGLAGNIEFLLDMYQATGDHGYLAECESLARLLLAQIVDAQGEVDWSADTLGWFTADYMLGYAGLAVALLRLSEPEQMPHQPKDCNQYCQEGFNG